jgi:hypothetical protein
MDNTRQDAGEMPFATPPTVQPMAPVLLMMAFWMLLGGASGIRVAQSIWQLLGWEAGDVSVAVPVGGVVGAAVGAALAQISSPRLLVLLMAVFAGASAGGVAGKIPWGEIGEIGGQVVGGLVGGIAWPVWLFIGRTKEPARTQPLRRGQVICSPPRPLHASPPDRTS